MKAVLPGSAIGLLGGGENSRMFALAASRMGYRVHVFSPAGDAFVNPHVDVLIQASYGDLDRVREFAAAVDVVTVTEGDVPAIALRAAGRSADLFPSAKVFEAIENGIGDKRDPTAETLAEFSVIGARAATGECVFYNPITIDRLDGILDTARSPAPIRPRLAKQAVALARDMLEDLDLIGLACVEFSWAEDRDLVVHEVTPHPHRCGHLTVDACVTSQFEQHLRAVCGLPLGSTEMMRPAALAVLSDDLWQYGEPAWALACAFPQVKLHPYGTRGGHLTATAKSATLAKQIVLAARARLTPRTDV